MIHIGDFTLIHLGFTKSSLVQELPKTFPLRLKLVSYVLISRVDFASRNLLPVINESISLDLNDLIPLLIQKPTAEIRVLDYLNSHLPGNTSGRTSELLTDMSKRRKHSILWELGSNVAPIQTKMWDRKGQWSKLHPKDRFDNRGSRKVSKSVRLVHH